MHKDPIVDEVRKIRQEYARQFNFDLRAIQADLQKQEQQHPERLVSFSPQPVRLRKTA